MGAKKQSPVCIEGHEFASKLRLWGVRPGQTLHEHETAQRLFYEALDATKLRLDQDLERARGKAGIASDGSWWLTWREGHGKDLRLSCCPLNADGLRFIA